MVMRDILSGIIRFSAAALTWINGRKFGLSRGRIVDKSLRTREGLELFLAVDDDLTAADAHAMFGQQRQAARQIFPRGADMRGQRAAVEGNHDVSLAASLCASVRIQLARRSTLDRAM